MNLTKRKKVKLLERARAIVIVSRSIFYNQLWYKNLFTKNDGKGVVKLLALCFYMRSGNNYEFQINYMNFIG